MNLKGLRRWVAIDAEGNAIAAGWTLGPFDPLELMFTSTKNAKRWQDDGCRYVRLKAGNIARMLQAGSQHRNIDEYDHGPVRRCRRARRMDLPILGQKS